MTMASRMVDPIWYVYGFVPKDAVDTSAAPAGIDDTAVRAERDDESGLAALVSLLDANHYAPDVLENSTGDVAWLSPRAVAHDRVLTWASDRGPVIPLPMFSVFSGRDALHATLRERRLQLEAALERVRPGREYSLRVYRVDAELLRGITDLSPRLRELASTAAAASPGQRYLLERKLDAEKRGEVRAVTRDIIDEILNALRPYVIAHTQSPIPRTAVDDATAVSGTMVLNAAFLVAPERLEPFQRELTDLVAGHGPHGFRFDFTGPWPPYHFVDEQTNGR